MNKENITCPNCEAEFYVESLESIKYCISCGDNVEDAEIYHDEDDWEDEED